MYNKFIGKFFCTKIPNKYLNYYICRMKKIKDLNQNEKRMLIMLCILIILVLISWKRVYNGVSDGFTKFFSTPQSQTEQVVK